VYLGFNVIYLFIFVFFLARNLECKLGLNVNISVIYFIADRRMYNRLLCNSFRCMCACVRVCLPYAWQFRLKVLVVVQHHHMVPTLYFPCSVSLILVLLFKNKKHANNHKSTKTFFTINLDPKSSDLFIFILS